MSSVFDKYINEVKKINFLPIVSDPNEQKKPYKVIGWSISNLFMLHFKSFIKVCIFYPLEIWNSKKLILATIRLKNSRNNRKVIVIGNGPSKGYLNVIQLDNFVNSGGETIVVNNWASDKEFSAHVPTWIVFSDPVTFDSLNEGSSELISYLRVHSKIKLIIPISLLDKVVKNNLSNPIHVFIDTECTFSKNINPLFPRGYLSMTLYKALAWANYLNYKKIAVIGMDNTYLRGLYSNENNDVLEVQENSGCESYVRNASNYYYNMAARIDDLTRLFHHLSYFPNKKTCNLDVYSLTDRFEKTSLLKFIKE
jgi:hypothetical protein